jgi:hypothetical protein
MDIRQALILKSAGRISLYIFENETSTSDPTIIVILTTAIINKKAIPVI